MQFLLCLLILYIDIGNLTDRNENLFSNIEIRTEARQKLNAVNCNRGIYLFIFVKLC